MSGAQQYGRWTKGLGIAIAVLALAAFSASLYVGGIYRARLAGVVKKELGAELITGSAFYRPPYGFVARDVRLVRRQANGTPIDLLHADGLSLDLGGIPRPGVAVDIRRLVLDRPVMRVERWRQPAPRTPASSAATAPTPGAAISSAPQTSAGPRSPAAPALPRLRLERLVINDGAVEYDRPDDGKAARLDHLQAELLESTAPDIYQCRVAFTDPKALDGDLTGTFDASSMRLQVARIALMAQARSVIEQLPLADQMVHKLIGMGIDGKLSVEGIASVPLHNLRLAQYQLTIGASDAVIAVPRWNASFDHGAGRLLLRSTTAATAATSAYPIELTIDHLQLASGRAILRIDGGTLEVFPDSKTWKLAKLVGQLEMGARLPFSPPNSGWFFDKGEFSGPVQFTMAADGPLRIPDGQSRFEAVHHELLAYPQGVTIRPRSFPLPIERVTGGPIACRGGILSLQNLSGNYGSDKLLLRSARLTIEDPARKVRPEDLRSQVKFEEIAGTLIFRQPNAAYPSVVGKTVAQLRPTGSFVVGGGSWYALNRPPSDRPEAKLKPDFFISLSGDGGSFAVSKYRVPLTDIQGEATLTPLAVHIRTFDAKSTGGTVWAAGLITPGRPWLYDGHAQARDIDLRQLAQALPLGETVRQRLSGQGYADLKLSGGSSDPRRSAADKFAADGELEILHGDFWSVPTVGDVASRLKKPEELGTGDAAGVVHIAHQIVRLENAAINSPLLGLQGSGTIGFDKSLDLTVVAAPLGDWRDRLQQAGAPVMGDILGAIQKALNSAQSALLFQFKVQGTLTAPATAVVPAPVLTQPIALLFGQMLHQPAPDQLLQHVKQKGATSQPARPDTRPASRRALPP